MEFTKITTSLSLIIILVIAILRLYETIHVLIHEKSYWIVVNFITIMLMILLLLFPINYFVTVLASMFLNKKYLLTNSKYYACNIPKTITQTKKTKLVHVLPDTGNNLNNKAYPSVTIQIPVYDEDFKEVLRPTLRTCIKIRDDYISQGGCCNIVVNDDGIFKLAEDKTSNLNKNKIITERINYYKKYNIGFTARCFKGRIGRFKKASNMNFGLKKITTHLFDANDYAVQNASSLHFEKPINELKLDIDDEINIILEEKIPFKNKVIIEHENITDDCLQGLVIDNNEISIVYGDISFGKYFVLIDSDSLIPLCSGNFITNVIKEFEFDEKLAYTQHFTIPSKESYQNYFARQISHFTINLNEIIFRLATRNGDISPLIGHNITVRTSALDKVSIDGNIWSENRVSEDFDICLRFHTAGYYGKFIAYPDMVFEEGVSLSYKDEMIKYTKFAYGASEILFNPINRWCKDGVFTQTIKKFMKSDTIPWTSKIGILGYMTSYFTVGLSIPFTPAVLLASCYLEHWELLFFDIFYSYVFTGVMFTIFTPTMSYIIKKRLTNETVTVDNKIQSPYYPKITISSEIKSAIFFSLFYSSISFPIFIGIICHIFSVNISWGSTVKTLKSDKCCKTIIKIIIDEKLQFIVMLIYLGILIFFNLQYQCNNIYVSISILSIIIGHLITPFILNPTLFNFNEHKYDLANTPSPQYRHNIDFF